MRTTSGATRLRSRTLAEAITVSDIDDDGWEANMQEMKGRRARSSLSDAA